eukprot:6468026-Amphidinium_carterae.1
MWTTATSQKQYFAHQQPFNWTTPTYIGFNQSQETNVITRYSQQLIQQQQQRQQQQQQQQQQGCQLQFFTVRLRHN